MRFKRNKESNKTVYTIAGWAVDDVLDFIIDPHFDISQIVAIREFYEDKGE
jgi:hypothetical protein